MNRSSALLAIGIALLGGVTGCSSRLNASGQQVQASSSRRPYALVGTWHYEASDIRTHQAIDLVLNADGTYTKTLSSVVDGTPYGGTHSGTWTADGMSVHLSGDGQWPAYTHDLSTFRKMS